MPLSTTFLASTPASLLSTPGATETVICGAVSFGPVAVVESKEKTSKESTSVSSSITPTTTAWALPSSATPVARSRGPLEPSRGARFAIACTSGLKASVRWSAETFAWEGGARQRESFFFPFEEVEKKEAFLSFPSLLFFLSQTLTGRGVFLANPRPGRGPRI